MGDFSSIKCIGKLAARLGQSLSTSIATFETTDFNIIPDIKVGEYNFTDGIGICVAKKFSKCIIIKILLK
jgi:hypothetical protein